MQWFVPWFTVYTKSVTVSMEWRLPCCLNNNALPLMYWKVSGFAHSPPCNIYCMKLRRMLIITVTIWHWTGVHWLDDVKMMYYLSKIKSTYEN